MSGKRIKPHWNFTLTRGKGTAYFLLAFLSAKYGTADPIAGYTATRDVQVSTLAVAVIKLLNPASPRLATQQYPFTTELHDPK